MEVVADTKTNEELLRMVAHWENHAEWGQFYGRYVPMLRRWCRGLGLDEDSVEEVCQEILIELATRMRTFRYDPNGSFRGWLRELCISRVRDFYRKRKTAVCPIGISDCPDERYGSDREASVEGQQRHGSEWGIGGELEMLVEARRVQDSVRAKVQSRTWEAFWLVAVYDWTFERTARSLGMTRTAVYAAHARVLRMLGEEGRRILERNGAGRGF